MKLPLFDCALDELTMITTDGKVLRTGKSDREPGGFIVVTNDSDNPQIIGMMGTVVTDEKKVEPFLVHNTDVTLNMLKMELKRHQMPPELFN